MENDGADGGLTLSESSAVDYVLCRFSHDPDVVGWLAIAAVGSVLRTGPPGRNGSRER